MKDNSNFITFAVLGTVTILIIFFVIIGNYEAELNKYRGDNSNAPYFISADGQTQITYPNNEQECTDTLNKYKTEMRQVSTQTEYNNLNSDMETIANHCLKLIEDDMEKEMSQY